MRLPTTLFLLASATLLASCAGPGGFVSQSSTLVEVRATAGTPTDIRFDRNGDELWEYARGPMGHETYLVRAGSDGNVKEVTQLLTQERLLTIVPGSMTKQDVRHVLGRPSDESFLRVGQTWSWRYKLGGTQPGFLVVTFNPDNTVKDRYMTVDPSGGDSRDSK